jgi:hypothetical protein
VPYLRGQGGQRNLQENAESTNAQDDAPMGGAV